MNKPTLLAALAIVCIAQLALPAWKLSHQLDLEASAPRFLCRARPIDPVDPLRGRYVAIDLEGLRGFTLEPAPGEDPKRHRGTAYLVFEEGEDGFATYALTRDKPESETWIRVRYSRSGDKAHVLRASLPFTRYYLEESRAPLAEDAYRRAAGEAQAWIALRVRSGDAALEELFIDGKPVLQWLKEHESSAPAKESALPPAELEVQTPEQGEQGEAQDEPGGLEEPLVGGQQHE